VDLVWNLWMSYIFLLQAPSSGQPPFENYVRTTNANPSLNSMHMLMIMISFVDKMVE
jgi:hypothetical protein